MRYRLQQLTEFDCFAKSFTYLAARLPRSEFLEPFLDEATVQPVEAAMKLMELFQAAKEKNISEAMNNCDVGDPLAGMQLVIGKPSEAALQAGDVPLSEAEPDMYPCLVALCGSGYGFMKVKVAHFVLDAIVIDINVTISQAVARIAYRTASQQTPVISDTPPMKLHAVNSTSFQLLYRTTIRINTALIFAAPSQSLKNITLRIIRALARHF